jgi:hypothetical protein
MVLIYPEHGYARLGETFDIFADDTSRFLIPGLTYSAYQYKLVKNW